MDLRQLRYFIAVAEERSFGRAASRLHVSQPPITRQIHALESELGVQLFERTRWGVNLTAAGEELLVNASQVEDMISYASDRARRAGEGTVGRVDVGVFGTGAITIVPAILRRYQAMNRSVEVMVFNAPQPAQLVALRQRRILITFDRYLPSDADLVVETVARERLMIAVHDESPLARLAVVPIALLKEQPMIMARDLRHRDWVRDLCRAHHFEPKTSQTVGDMVSGVLLAANGFGVQIVAESVQSLKLPRLVYRPLQTTAPAYAFMHLQCAYLKDEESPMLRGILEVVHEYRGKETTKNDGRHRSAGPRKPSGRRK